MKAIRIHNYGGPEVLVYEDAPRPTPGVGEVLVKAYVRSQQQSGLLVPISSSSSPTSAWVADARCRGEGAHVQHERHFLGLARLQHQLAEGLEHLLFKATSPAQAQGSSIPSQGIAHQGGGRPG